MRNKIDNSACEFATFIKLLLQHKKIDSKIEFARFTFLKEVYPDKTIKEAKNLINFNCKTAVSGLFSSMCMNNVDILSSRQRISTCSTCTTENTCESPLLNTNIEDLDYKDIQKSIMAEKIRVCDTCENRTMQTLEKFHDIVAIDCERLRKSQQKLACISDIQNEIKLDERQYELFAAIEFDPRLEHYIAHIKRKTWETYDDMRRSIIDTDIDQNRFIFMLFYKNKSNGIFVFFE